MISHISVKPPAFWKMLMSGSGISRPPKVVAPTPAQTVSGAPCNGGSDESRFYVSSFFFIVFQAREAVAFWAPCGTHELV